MMKLVSDLQVMFCGSKCQTDANQKYHHAECAPYSRFCHANGKIYILGDNFDRIIRLLATIGIDKLEAYYKYARTDITAPMSDTEKRTKGFDSHGIFDSSKLDTVFNLITMNQHRNQEELLDVSLFTLQIPRCFGISMEHPDFFAVAGLCLQLQDTATHAAILKSYCNFKSIPMEHVCVAGCFNSLFSLINHSCISNLTFVQYGDKHVSIAKWPIKKGTVLTESYHSFDVRCSKEQRQKLLKEGSLFECKCEACENNWKFEDKLECISDPADGQIASVMCYTHKTKVIVGMHMNFPPSHCAPIFTAFVKDRNRLLTKMWNKGEFHDIRCHEIQYQLMVYQSLQGNRVVYPIKHSPRVLQDPVAVDRIIDSLMITI
ncbi:hypothetical protein B566_EDAN010840 [Ephemera danica]|nr:hypothetical protein B566_EDAN010840 [Ephemera danica]